MLITRSIDVYESDEEYEDAWVQVLSPLQIITNNIVTFLMAQEISRYRYIGRPSDLVTIAGLCVVFYYTSRQE